MFRPRLASVLACTFVFLLLTGRFTPANAQETTGTIKGRLVDQQGLPVAGVNISIIGSQAGHRLSI